MIEQPKNYTTERGNKYWYLPSKGRDYYHRLEGPAVEGADGSKHWYVDDKLHRLDGPAIEEADGTKEWLVDGKRHRLDGPAVERANGTKQWWEDGKVHRLDGPAVEWSDGTNEWWINDKKLPMGEVETWLEENNIDLSTEIGQIAFKLRWI